MITAEEAQTRQLDRLDSPRRVAWLRSKTTGYIRDLAARSYFRLPTCCAGVQIPSPKVEALAACVELAASHNLTPAEYKAAFDAEWSISIKLAEKAGEKLKIAALSHLKLTRDTSGITTALRATRNRWPEDYPFLSDVDLDAIAAGFRARIKGRAA